jgi:hypothetical protein
MTFGTHLVYKEVETIRENIKISVKESLGYYEPRRINHGSMKDAQNYYQRKQVKLDWLQDPSEGNGNNLNIRCETSRHFKNKMREYLKDKIDELATNSMNKNIRDLYRGINYFKGYKSISNLVVVIGQ